MSYSGPHVYYTEFPKSAIVNITLGPALMRRAQPPISLTLNKHGQKLLFAGTGRNGTFHDPVVSSSEKESPVSTEQEVGRAPDPVWWIWTEDDSPVYC